MDAGFKSALLIWAISTSYDYDPKRYYVPTSAPGGVAAPKILPRGFLVVALLVFLIMLY
jgi:hypothetical protein